MDRAVATYLPLTAQVLAARLTGEVFIGPYPLPTDNTCLSLAAICSGSAAMLDALAYAKAARVLGPDLRRAVVPGSVRLT